MIRLAFIRKVYSILSVMLLVTFGSVTFCTVSQEYKNFWKSSSAIGLVVVSCVLSIVVTCALICCQKVARTVPVNYILLAIYTLSMTVLLTFTAATYTSESVFMAMALTCAMSITLTLYAVFTKTDFTTKGGILLVGVVVLFLGSIMMISGYSKVLDTIMCILGIIVFSGYIIYDTQLIVGGKKHQLTIDDYVIGALMLYADIINLFLYILRLLGSKE